MSVNLRGHRRSVALASSAIVTVLLLTACGAGSATPTPSVSSSGPTSTPSAGTVVNLPISGSATGATLRDQDGNPVSLASLGGKTVVVAPFLTLCQEICPFTSTNLRTADAAVQAAGLGSQVEFLEVSVDPARDDLAHLKAYQKLFGAQPNWQFVSGTPQRIAAFWKGLHLFYKDVPNAPGDHPTDWLTGRPLTYDVDHQDVIYVLAPDGTLSWFDVGTPWSNHAPLPATLQSYLSDEGLHNQKVEADQAWTVPDLLSAIGYTTGHRIPLPSSS